LSKIAENCDHNIDPSATGRWGPKIDQCCHKIGPNCAQLNNKEIPKIFAGKIDCCDKKRSNFFPKLRNYAQSGRTVWGALICIESTCTRNLHGPVAFEG
jgi:hypothetical protein